MVFKRIGIIVFILLIVICVFAILFLLQIGTVHTMNISSTSSSIETTMPATTINTIKSNNNTEVVNIFGNLNGVYINQSLTTEQFYSYTQCANYSKSANRTLNICYKNNRFDDFLLDSVNQNNTATLYFYFIPPAVTQGAQFRAVKAIVKVGQIVYDECGVKNSIYSINYTDASIIILGVANSSVCPL